MKRGHKRQNLDACDRGARMPVRRGFTLIELMMVIAIILLLIALLLPAVLAATEMVAIVKTRNLISQIELGLESFKSDFGYYPPSGDRGVAGSAGNWGANKLYSALGTAWGGAAGTWPDGTAAPAGSPIYGPYGPRDVSAVSGGTYVDYFKPSKPILYWRSHASTWTGSPSWAQPTWTQYVYTVRHNPYDRPDGTAVANGHWWYLVCDNNNTGGNGFPRNPSYILMSAGSDRKWGFYDGAGNYVSSPSSGRCDDITNF